MGKTPHRCPGGSCSLETNLPSSALSVSEPPGSVLPPLPKSPMRLPRGPRDLFSHQHCGCQRPREAGSPLAGLVPTIHPLPHPYHFPFAVNPAQSTRGRGELLASLAPCPCTSFPSWMPALGTCPPRCLAWSLLLLLCPARTLLGQGTRPAAPADTGSGAYMEALHRLGPRSRDPAGCCVGTQRPSSLGLDFCV